MKATPTVYCPYPLRSHFGMQMVERQKAVATSASVLGGDMAFEFGDLPDAAADELARFLPLYVEQTHGAILAEARRQGERWAAYGRTPTVVAPLTSDNIRALDGLHGRRGDEIGILRLLFDSGCPGDARRMILSCICRTIVVRRAVEDHLRELEGMKWCFRFPLRTRRSASDAREEAAA